MSWSCSTMTFTITFLYCTFCKNSSSDNYDEKSWMKISLTILIFAMGSYLQEKMLRKDFIQHYKAKESYIEFNEILKSIPEGVSIIDDHNSEFKFINHKLKNTFDVRLFSTGDKDNPDFLNQVQNQVVEEFDKFISSMDKGPHDKYSEDFLKCLFGKFNVEERNGEKDKNFQNFS